MVMSNRIIEKPPRKMTLATGGVLPVFQSGVRYHHLASAATLTIGRWWRIISAGKLMTG